MLYLSDRQIERAPRRWAQLVACIEAALAPIAAGDFAQPLKPYLRYGDPRNRIIAMPAYLGGSFSIAGIKWIASFPGNALLGLPRAHSVVVLNDASTGRPEAILSSGTLSAIRTAAVSGLFLELVRRTRELASFSVGLLGFGPIGRMHLEMLDQLCGDHLRRVRLHDPCGVEASAIPESLRARCEVVDSWQAAYDGADVVLTCTVTSERYIDRPLARGSVHLNISLRDYQPRVLAPACIIVDDWNEVCRENTDVAVLHEQLGLSREDCLTLGDAATGALARVDPACPLTFHPMGLAVFDLAIAHHYRNALGLEAIHLE